MNQPATIPSSPVGSPIAEGWVVSVNTGPGGVPRYPRSGGDWLTATGLRGDDRALAKHHQPGRVLSLLSIELLAEFQRLGFPVYPGAMAENLTTSGIDLMALPIGSEIWLGSGPKQVEGARVCVAQYRKPCYQLDPYGPGLKEICVERCGLLCSFLREGPVMAGMRISVYPPSDTQVLSSEGQHDAPRA